MAEGSQEQRGLYNPAKCKGNKGKKKRADRVWREQLYRFSLSSLSSCCTVNGKGQREKPGASVGTLCAGSRHDTQASALPPHIVFLGVSQPVVLNSLTFSKDRQGKSSRPRARLPLDPTGVLPECCGIIITKMFLWIQI